MYRKNNRRTLRRKKLYHPIIEWMLKMSGELMLLFIILTLFLASCRGTEISTEFHQTRTENADYEVSEAKEEVSSRMERYDSLLLSLLQQEISQQTRRDEQLERIEERIHTQTDTSGNTVRNEIRTIERTRSTETEEDLLCFVSQQWEKIAYQQQMYDSLLRAFMASGKSQNLEKNDYSEKKENDWRPPIMTVIVFIVVTLIIFLTVLWAMDEIEVFHPITQFFRNLFRLIFRK